ncbi:hypothetical protein ACQPZ8_16275 [Actinomadura nitritigenes]|uniref:hypothetical protein n=1 Tax=Actinomadura nitritigenes TaxID=134602 RepID=UPI003D91F277
MKHQEKAPSCAPFLSPDFRYFRPENPPPPPHSSQNHTIMLPLDRLAMEPPRVQGEGKRKKQEGEVDYADRDTGCGRHDDHQHSSGSPERDKHRLVRLLKLLLFAQCFLQPFALNAVTY